MCVSNGARLHQGSTSHKGSRFGFSLPHRKPILGGKTMRATLSGLFLALLIVLPLTPALADDYDDTIKVFREAGESGKFQIELRLCNLSDHRQGRRRNRRRAQLGARVPKGATSATLDDADHRRPSARRPGIQPDHLLRGQARLRRIHRRNFEFGAQASAVAITAGAQAHGTTGTGARERRPARCHHRRRLPEGNGNFTVAKGGLMYGEHRRPEIQLQA